MQEHEYIPELYTLCDEEGVEQTFEMLDTMEIGEDKYYAMVPYFENPDDLIEADGGLVVLKSEMVDGEEMLVSIDDDEEYERIGAMFLDRLQEMYEEDDCDCEDDDCDCSCHCDHCGS